jgi:hypothetical protein
MPSSVTLVDRHLLLLCFPYNTEINDALRDATENRVHWDPKLRGFTLSADRLRRDPTMVAKLTRFIGDYGLDADAGIRQLLAFRTVKAASPLARPESRRLPTDGHLGPGQLRCDLLPASTWGSNLRGVFSSHRNVQRLDRLIALCPDCHRAQHIGLAGVKGETDLVIGKLREVNSWTRAQATLEMNRAWAEYARRQAHSWDLDLSALCDVITIDGYPELYFRAEERGRLGNSYFM